MRKNITHGGCTIVRRCAVKMILEQSRQLEKEIGLNIKNNVLYRKAKKTYFFL